MKIQISVFIMSILNDLTFTAYLCYSESKLHFFFELFITLNDPFNDFFKAITRLKNNYVLSFKLK